MCSSHLGLNFAISFVMRLYSERYSFSHCCLSCLRVRLQCLCVRQEFPWGHRYGHTCLALINHDEKHKDFTATRMDFASQRDKRRFQLLLCHVWSLLIKQQMLLQVLKISAVSLNLL